MDNLRYNSGEDNDGTEWQGLHCWRMSNLSIKRVKEESRILIEN
jgi:hypothetical protein